MTPSVFFSADGNLLALLENPQGGTRVHRTEGGGLVRRVEPFTGGFALARGASLDPSPPLAIAPSGTLFCVDGGGNVRTAAASATKWAVVSRGKGMVSGALLAVSDACVVAVTAGSGASPSTVRRVASGKETTCELPAGCVPLALILVGGDATLWLGDGDAVVSWAWRASEASGERGGVVDLPKGDRVHLAPLRDGSLVAVTRRPNPVPSTWLRKQPPWTEILASQHDREGRLLRSFALPFGQDVDLVVTSSALRRGDDAIVLATHPRGPMSNRVRVLASASAEPVSEVGLVSPSTFRLDPTGRIATVTKLGAALPIVLDRATGTITADLSDPGAFAPHHPFAVTAVAVDAVRAADAKASAPPAIPSAPQFTWGGLFVRPKRGKLNVTKIRAAVDAAYEENDLARVAWRTIDDLKGVVDPSIPDAARSDASALGPDEVLFAADGVGWCGVFSRALELTSLVANPLAMKLSRAFDVLQIQTERDAYVAYVRYEKGKASSASTWPGSKGDARELDRLPELDLAWLVQSLAPTSGDAIAPTPEELREVSVSPERIVKAGLGDPLGHRDAFEGAPLEERDPDDYRVYRAR